LKAAPRPWKLIKTGSARELFHLQIEESSVKVLLVDKVRVIEISQLNKVGIKNGSRN